MRLQGKVALITGGASGMGMVASALFAREGARVVTDVADEAGERTAAESVTGIIALVSLASLYLDSAYRPAVYGIAVWFGIGLLYFAIVGRNRLILSPEEEFALTQGGHGHPESEGYGTTHVAPPDA